MSKQIKSSLILLIAGIALVFVASVMALVSYKVGYWPWELDWLNNGMISSPVLSIITENIVEVAALGISMLLFALYVAIERREIPANESEIDAVLPDDDANGAVANEDVNTDKQGISADGREASDPEAASQKVASAASPDKVRDNQLQIALSEVTRLKKDLVISRRETESAEKARAQFLSNMSHELRTPMNGIMGMSELLNECELPKKEKHFASSISASSESLLSIINDLLDYSRMEAGDMRLEQARFNLSACVEEVCAVLATSTQNKGVELICYVDEDLPKYVNGDAARLRQVLNNLITNSIAFTDNGEIVVRVARTESSDATHTFKCDVQDTGAGIAPEMQATLFESFKQADQSNTRRHGGLGIGLAITNELVSLMDGELSFRSRLGEGTRFTFTAKFQRVADEDDSKVSTGSFAGARVLIVDDNATNRSILSHQVTGWGLEADCAQSGAQALSVLTAAAADNKLHDLLILDLHMPEMDGIELARKIRNTPAIASIKTMMLTSAIIDLSATEMLELGIEFYISKPARQSQLRECLRDLYFSDSAATDINRGQVKPLASDVPAKVLLAEDDAVNLDVASRMLKGSNCIVTVATNGKEAVDAATKQPFDIIFMDCEMPVLNGFMAANQIKQGGGPNVDTPIVALTANSMPGDRERCLDAGMQHYISKPVRQQQVVKAIVDWASANSSGVDTPDEQANVVKLSAPDIDLDSSSVVTQADGHQDGASKQIGEPAIKPSEAASNAEIINSEAIDKIRELQRPGKADLLSKVLTLYFDKTPEQIDLLLQAVTDEDFEQAKSIAHGMKSSSAYLGAEDLASTCGELESSIRDGKTDNVATLADLILEQYCAAEAELKQFVKAA